MTKSTLTLATVSALAVAIAVTPAAFADFGHDCHVGIDHDVEISNGDIIIGEDGRERVRITNDDALFVDGQEIELDAEQQGLVSQYAEGLREVLPEVAAMALDAGQLAVDAVGAGFAGLLGEDSDGYRKVMKSMARLIDGIEAKFEVGADHVVLRAGDWNVDGSDIDAALAEAIGTVMRESVGTLLMSLGAAIIDGEGSFGARTAAFEARMERMGQDIERVVESRATALAHRADAVCARLPAIRQTEAALREQIPALAQHFVLH